jgi:hypothetical protein
MPIARQGVAKHIPVTTNTSIARQRRGEKAFTTIQEAVFSMDPSRDYISVPFVHQKSVVVRRIRIEGVQRSTIDHCGSRYKG